MTMSGIAGSASTERFNHDGSRRETADGEVQAYPSQKFQNTKRSLIGSVRAIQNSGLLVYGGFIIGFDSDTDDIFDRQIEFINDAAIPYAMVGLLGALPGTPLYIRLEEEGRLKGSTFAGD